MESLYDVLPLAIRETHYGTAHAPYRAFFKSSLYETFVDHILSSISIGAALRVGSNKKVRTPSLVCALKPGTVIVQEAGQVFDIFDVCTKNPTWMVLFYPGASSVLICASFFRVPTMPAGSCPTVNRATNQLEGDFDLFAKSQAYMLLHELAHFYLGITVEDGAREIMDWNYAASLPPANATKNALNYVLYVASKLFAVDCLISEMLWTLSGANVHRSGVVQECQEFPNSDQAQPSGGHGRRLGATLDLLNTSSVVVDSVRDIASPFHTDMMNTTLLAKNSTN